MSQLSHFDAQGSARMVDVGSKRPTRRRARARGVVRMAPDTLRAICDRSLAKGDVLAVARLAGIMAAKRTAELIPLCHPLPLESVELAFEPIDAESIAVAAEVQVTARTGVEMEAMVAVAIAALTIYDMCKGVDRSMEVESLRLEEKSGGRSGHFRREEDRRTSRPRSKPGS